MGGAGCGELIWGCISTFVNRFYIKGGRDANSKSIERHICKVADIEKYRLFTQVGQFLSSIMAEIDLTTASNTQFKLQRILHCPQLGLPRQTHKEGNMTPTDTNSSDFESQTSHCISLARLAKLTFCITARRQTWQISVESCISGLRQRL